MDKEISYREFVALVYNIWGEDRFKYGSMQFPAYEAVRQLKEQGVTNNEELLERLRKEKGDYFYHAGD